MVFKSFIKDTAEGAALYCRMVRARVAHPRPALPFLSRTPAPTSICRCGLGSQPLCQAIT
jgi:hypothetical protein